MSFSKKNILLFLSSFGKINLYLLLIALMLTDAWAGQWTRSLGLGDPDKIFNLQACENRVYATTNGIDEIYYSDNHGDSWSTFAFKKYDVGTFLASGHKKFIKQGETIFCSSCKDTSWTPILTVPSSWQIFLVDEKLYVLKNDTFFIADLDGSNFHPVSPKLPFPIKNFAVAGQTIFAVNDSWRDTTGTEHEENLNRFGPGDQSWVQLTNRSWPDNITAMAAVGGRIFAGTMHGLYVWSEADSALLSISNSEWVNGLFSAFGKLIVAPWDSIKLNDAAMASAGIPAGLIEANMLDYQTVLTAAGDSTLYILNETVNVGRHVAYFSQYDGFFFGSQKGLFSSEVMGPGTSVDELLFDGKTLWGYSKTTGLFRSDNMGKSWGGVCYPCLGEPRAFAKIGAKLCLVTANGVHVFSDTGFCWGSADLGDNTNRIFLDAFISGSDAFVTSTSGFFKTMDAGKTWTTINQKANQTGSCALHGEDIMFFTNDSIHQIVHSADGGATWKTACQADSAAERFWGISASDAGALVYSSTRGILYSGDGGATWKPRNKGIADSLQINSMHCHQHTLLASTNRYLFIWSDSLNSWVKKSIGQQSGSTVWLTSVGPYVFAYAWGNYQYNEMFLSPDGGKTWESVGAISYRDYNDHHQQLSYSFSNEEFFVGSDGGLWRHPITKPVFHYTRSVPPLATEQVRPGSTITYTITNRTLRFKFPTGFSGSPSLNLISINGRNIATLRPAFFDGAAGTTVFRLTNLASGTLIFRFVLKGTVKKTGILIIPSF